MFLLLVFIPIFILLLVLWKRYTPSLELHPTQPRSFKLASKESVNHNTILLRFNLSSPNSLLSLPTGKHISLQTDMEGETISRSYTPISSRPGSFDLLVKVYPKGRMTQVLDQMEVGQYIQAVGPKGSLEYLGCGFFTSTGRGQQKSRFINMIAGGSGITPMYQILRRMVSEPISGNTSIRLVYGNVSEADILLRQELDSMVENYSHIQVYYTLDVSPGTHWKGGVGFVTRDMLSQQLSLHEESLYLLCGPPMMNKAVKQSLKLLNIPSESIHVL